MMKWFLRIVLIGLLALSAPVFSWGADAQPQSWESLLDRYESICLECMNLRSRKEAGQTIPARRLQLLLDELEELREQIKGSTDKMPPAARYRFEAIRRMYASGKPMPTRPPTVEGGMLLPWTQLVAMHSTSFQPEPRPTSPLPVRLKPLWSISFSSIILPDPTPGIRMAYYGKKWGGYASVHNNFSRHETAYDALSDGSSGNARIWTSGTSASDRFFLSLGPTYRLGEHFALFAGLGYGYRKLCWEDSEGNWMRIADASPTGLCTELGATFLWRKVSLSASWISLPFSYSGLTLSAGWCF